MKREPARAAWDLKALGRGIPPGRVSRSLDKMHTEYAWQAVVPRGGFLYDTLDEWADVASAVRAQTLDVLDSVYARGGIDQGFYRAERGFAVLIGQCWRAPGYGSLVRKTPLVVHSAEQRDELKKALRKKGSDYQARLNAMPTELLRQVWLTTSIPIGHGKGYPTFLSGTHLEAGPLIAAAVRGARTFGERTQRLTDAVAPQIEDLIAILRRIQSNPGEQPTWLNTLDGLVPDEDEVIKVKSRQVRLTRWDTNLDHAQPAAVLKFLLFNNPAQTTTGNVNAAAAAMQYYRAGAGLDVKQFDDSTASETISEWGLSVLAPCLHVMQLRGLIDYHKRMRLLESFEAVNNVPVLCPSPFKNEAHRLIPHHGTVVSGLIYTSQIGSDIVDCLFQVGARRAGLTEYRFFNQGDDVFFTTRNRAALERLIALERVAGYRLVPADDTAFLMTRLTAQGATAYRYLARMLDGCINREVMREPTTLLEYAAGVGVRYVLLGGSPLQSYFLPILESTGNARLISACALVRTYGPLALAQRAMRAKSDAALRTAGAWFESLRELLQRAGLERVSGISNELERYERVARARVSDLDNSTITVVDAQRLLRDMTRDNA